MKSMRRHILSRLLPGFALLWIGAGVAMFWLARQWMETRLDANLREIASSLPVGGRRSDGALGRFESFFKEDRGVYFSIWDPNGMLWLKSDSLGSLALDPPARFEERGVYLTQELASGESVRVLAFRAQDTSALGTVHVMVALSREELQANLARLIAGTVVAGVIGGVIFGLLVGMALRSGMRPLADLGDRAERIQARSLSERFSEAEAPREVLPIVRQLNDLMARLEESFSRERRFGADLAHELRTPVSALISTAEVALKFPETASDENYEDIREISEELQVTIENLLTLGYLENAEAQVARESVNLRSLFEECWMLYAPKAEERAVEIVFDLGEKATIETDPRLIRIIATNLLSNAAEYAPEGGTIRVEGSLGNRLFALSNAAPHLEPADLPKLFHRLWRHDRARTDSSHSGLGLSLARACAEALSLNLTAKLDEVGLLTFQLLSPPN